MNNWISLEDKVDNEIRSNGSPEAIDIVRRQKMQRIVDITGRALVIYAMDWTSKNLIRGQVVSNLLSLSPADVDDFEYVTRRLQAGSYAGLDVFLHSPGGQIEPTESIVEIMRSRFSNVRFIISNAKSAATMMAMSGNELLMDEVSELGPTDPQITITRNNQPVTVPVQYIIDDFARAEEEVAANPNRIAVWMPILGDYRAGLLAQCTSALKLSEHLVYEWLLKYMFEGDEQAKSICERAAQTLSTHGNFFSHARRIGINQLIDLGLKVRDMSKDPDLRDLHDAVRELHRTINLTFEVNQVGKIFENNLQDLRFVGLNVQTENQQPPTQPQQNQQSGPPSVRPAPHSGPGQQGQNKRRSQKNR